MLISAVHFGPAMAPSDPDGGQSGSARDPGAPVARDQVQQQQQQQQQGGGRDSGTGASSLMVTLEVTDGWYSMAACVDEPLAQLALTGKLKARPV